MAAKRKRKQERSSTAWLALTFGLVMAALAGFALLGGSDIFARVSPAGSSRAANVPDSPVNHDRDQIDEDSRKQLREILRAASREQ